MKKVVIKIGSGTILTKRGKLDEFVLLHIAEQVMQLQRLGFGVVLIVSGAVACGVVEVKSNEKNSLSKEGIAGVGQVTLIATMKRLFESKGMSIAQLLLTADALLEADRRAKVKQVLEDYSGHGVVAIVNENDVVDLNGFGGNDLLAMHIATLLGAEQVLILSQMAASVHGVGGGESKLHVVRILGEAGIGVRIINGRDKNGILENVI